jgi:acyl-CoA thioester hydrolase
MSDPAELPEVARIRVIYGDTDQMGMVYYGNYLRYFEIGRNEFLRRAGAPYRAFEESHGLMLPVVEAAVFYRRPARYDDELGIHAAVPEVRGASARFAYAIRRLPDGELLVEGHTVHACVDGSGRVTRIPAGLRAALGAQRASATAACGSTTRKVNDSVRKSSTVWRSWPVYPTEKSWPTVSS